MLKNILNLEGAQQLSKNEQNEINGGKTPNWCVGQPNGTKCGGAGYYCRNGVCSNEPF